MNSFFKGQYDDLTRSSCITSSKFGGNDKRARFSRLLKMFLNRETNMFHDDFRFTCLKAGIFNGNITNTCMAYSYHYLYYKYRISNKVVKALCWTSYISE